MASRVQPIIATNEGGGDFELVPAGVYLARCFKMVDIGTQPAQQVGGKTFKAARKVILYWELLADDEDNQVRMESGDPFSVSKEYTLSMWETANLRQDLDSWRGVPFTEEQAKDFDITNLLDKFCKIQVVHKKSKDGKKTYANVDAIMTTRKTAEGVNAISGFSITNPDMELFETFSDYIKDKIRAAQEWKVGTQDGDISPEGKVIVNEDGGEPIPMDSVPF
jgi:hypothetical protein